VNTIAPAEHNAFSSARRMRRRRAASPIARAFETKTKVLVFMLKL